MKFFLFPLAIIFQLSDMVQNLPKQSSDFIPTALLLDDNKQQD